MRAKTGRVKNSNQMRKSLTTPQVTVQLPGAGERHLRVSPGASVADLLASATAGAKLAGGGSLPACAVFCGARRLRAGATLAAAGVADGARLEVRPTVGGGMRPGQAASGGLAVQPAAKAWHSYRSITRAGMRAVFAEARTLLRGMGYTGKMTSHTLQGLFKNTLKAADGKTCLDGPAPFHPAERWAGHYSAHIPTIVVTYTWAMDLENELDKFMDAAERMLGLSAAEKKKATWWLDILFNDQRGLEAMDVVLRRARRCYLMGENHVAFLKNGIFKRGWCCAELAYRIQVPRNRA